MTYIFPERSEESQQTNSSSEQEVPVEESVAEQEVPVEEPTIQEQTTPVILETTPPLTEASLPPEARGETNGGPLGCCLGTILGLFLAFALVTGLSILMASGGTFVTIPVTFLGACVGGFLGWRIGKRIYKEYEPPVVRQRAYSYSTRPKAKRGGNMPK
ncbi:MAG TPA: hypothetical protein DHW02_24690 [Ktedonobacter sp.]|nr:hypothetical protein [Ktedonobacter sp.]